MSTAARPAAFLTQVCVCTVICMVLGGCHSVPGASYDGGLVAAGALAGGLTYREYAQSSFNPHRRAADEIYVHGTRRTRFGTWSLAEKPLRQTLSELFSGTETLGYQWSGSIQTESRSYPFEFWYDLNYRVNDSAQNHYYVYRAFSCAGCSLALSQSCYGPLEVAVPYPLFTARADGQAYTVYVTRSYAGAEDRGTARRLKSLLLLPQQELQIRDGEGAVVASIYSEAYVQDTYTLHVPEGDARSEQLKVLIGMVKAYLGAFTMYE